MVLVGSRLLPLVLATAALAAGAAGPPGLAFWLGLAVVPAAAAAVFVAASDALEGRPARLGAATSGLALAFAVLASAARAGATTGGAVPPLATWSLLLVLGCYAAPGVAWLLAPVRLQARTRPERRRRPIEAGEDVVSRAA